MCLSIVPSTRRQYAYSGDLSGTTSFSRALRTFAISIYPSLLFLPPLTSFNRCYPPSLPPSLPLYPTWLLLWSTSLASPSNSYLPLPPSCPPPSLPCCHPRLPPSSASLVCLPVQSLSTSSSCLPPQPVTSSIPIYVVFRRAYILARHAASLVYPFANFPHATPPHPTVPYSISPTLAHPLPTSY